MTSIVHSLTFNSEVTAKRVDIGDDTIGFSTFHKLDVGDKVQYDAKDGTPMVGLSTNGNPLLCQYCRYIHNHTSQKSIR